MPSVHEKRVAIGQKLNIASGKDILRRLVLSEHFVLYLSILYFLVLLPFIPRLASPQNFSNLLSNMWPLLIVAIGQTFVLIVGGIDLSQASIMATTSVAGALLMTSELNPVLFEKSPLWGVLISAEGGLFAGGMIATPVGITIMLGIGALIGVINGLSIARLRMPPFMVTLVTMIFFSAFAIYLTKSENVTYLPDSFITLGRQNWGFLSYALFIAAGVALLAHVTLTRTVLGRWFYAIGKNIRTAKTSGVPTERVMILAYVFSGICAAAAAVLYSARLEAGRPTLGQSILLDIVGATVIGGTSLFGGKGKVIWTLYGVFFFTLLANTLNLLNLSFYAVNIVKGSIILLAAFLDVTRPRFRIQQ